MKIGIIHLSDIHIKDSATDNYILLKSNKIVSALQNRIIDFQEIFIVISGDIAFSGKKSEYSIARTFLLDLKNALKEYSKKDISIILVPGNHDCNFDEPHKTRNLLINGLEAQDFLDLDEDLIAQCCEPQEFFFDFQKEFLTNGGSSLFSNELINIVEFQSGDVNLIFNCFNTSWTSNKNEEPGKIAFPINYFNEETFENVATIKINIIHHPLNWQSNTTYRDLRRFLNSNGNLTLSGHEHLVDINRMTDKFDNSNFFIESAALQDLENPQKSFFNLITLDLDKNIIKVDLYDYKNGSYSKTEILSEKKFLEIEKKKDIKIPLSNDFSSYLDTLNAQFLHRRADSIYLDDLYVSPFLRTFDEIKGKSELINFNELLHCQNLEKNIFIGEEGAGKTTLCKKIFKETHANGRIPILLKGLNIEKSTFEYVFHDLLKVAFAEQYNKRFINNFEELDKNNIIIIIDDFQSCKLRDDHRKALVQLLNENFKTIIFTSDSLLYFNPVAEIDGQFADYKTYTILEFSYELRYEIIKKWNSLGETEILGNDLQRKNESYDQLVKDFLGKNFLPQYPFIIIIALQSLDFSASSEQGFSYYYKFLIEESLKKNIKHKDELLFYNLFLAEYCFFLFNERIKTLNKDSFEGFFKKYVKRKKVTLSFKDAYSQLINSKTIKCSGDFISIPYPYIYYYYVASYLAHYIDKPDVKELIKKLIDRLYVDEYAGIIIFLSQISSNQFITNTIKNRADNYFNEYSPATLSTDIEKIDGLLNKIPELILEDKNIEDRRKIEIKKRALAEDKERKLDEEYLSKEYDLDNDLSKLSLLNVFIRSVKTFEIYGQVIKKNWGSYDGDIKELFVNSTFNLSMRVLSAYFTLIQNSAYSLMDHIYYVADKREISDKREIEKLAKDYIFYLAYITSYGIIKRVADSISHEQLKETFDEVISKNPTNSNKLIRLSIIMDHFGMLPNDEINNLFNKERSFHRYFLPKMILQNFIYHYLHIYEVPHTERNRICSIAGIKIKEQRAIQERSQEKK